MHSIFILVQAVTCKYLKINIKFSCLGNKYLKIFFLKKKIFEIPKTMIYNQIGSGTFLKIVSLCHIKLFSISAKNIQEK